MRPLGSEAKLMDLPRKKSTFRPLLLLFSGWWIKKYIFHLCILPQERKGIWWVHHTGGTIRRRELIFLAREDMMSKNRKTNKRKENRRKKISRNTKYKEDKPQRIIRSGRAIEEKFQLSNMAERSWRQHQMLHPFHFTQRRCEL